MKLSELKKGDEVVVIWQDSLRIAKISKINSRTIVVDGGKYWTDGGKSQGSTGAWPYIEPSTPEWADNVRLFELAMDTLGYASISWRWMHHAGEKLDDLKKGHERYEKLRKLNLRQLADLYNENLAGKPFDELVDGL